MKRQVVSGAWSVEALAKAQSPRWFLGAVLGFALLTALSAACAMPRFRLQAIVQFHYDKDYPLWEYDKRAMACTYCHVNATGGPPWNAFGEALRAQFVADAAAGQKNKFPQVLYDLLKAGQDSDGDGYSDALEVFAKTLPADPSSKPDKPVAQLQKEFDAAGGVEQYKPVGAREVGSGK